MLITLSRMILNYPFRSKIIQGHKKQSESLPSAGTVINLSQGSASRGRPINGDISEPLGNGQSTGLSNFFTPQVYLQSCLSMSLLKKFTKSTCEKPILPHKQLTIIGNIKNFLRKPKTSDDIDFEIMLLARPKVGSCIVIPRLPIGQSKRIILKSIDILVWIYRLPSIALKVNTLLLKEFSF